MERPILNVQCPIRKVGDAYQGAVIVDGVFSHAIMGSDPATIIQQAYAVWATPTYAEDVVILTNLTVINAKAAQG